MVVSVGSTGSMIAKIATEKGRDMGSSITVGGGSTEVAANKKGSEVCAKRLGSSFCCSAARMQQKDKELQIDFCNPLISLVSPTGYKVEPYACPREVTFC